MWKDWEFCGFEMHRKNGRESRAADTQRSDEEPVVAEALTEIQDKFRTARSEGPLQAVYFPSSEDEQSAVAQW